jgi:hypothetical protein
MKFLEAIAGGVIALFTAFVLLVGSAFALGSIGRYIRARNM